MHFNTAHHHGGGKSMFLTTYVDAPNTPLFPLGHGLSYTTWSYSDLAVTTGSTLDAIEVAVTLTNTGGREGDEVVQVFARDELASVGVPARRLVAFRRVTVAAGEAVHVGFTIPAGALGFHGRDMRFRVEPGDVTLLVGGLEHSATITGEVVHPDPNDVPAFGFQRDWVSGAS